MLAALGAASLAVLTWLSGCSDRSVVPPPAQAARVANTFVGNAACKPCHPAEFESHRRCRHALALRPMDREDLGPQSPTTGEISNSGYVLISEGDHYLFGREGERQFPLQFVFGSGKSGMAFAAIPMEGVLAEARMSYYPATKRWFVTPGQQSLSDRSLGNMTRGQPARQCLGCHTVTLLADTLMPERKFMGVGCESCHGAAGEHIAAMQSGDRTRGAMQRLGGLGGAAVNELCGRCHRTEHDVTAKNLSPKHTDLFQAHGLAQSACFRQSGDKLTCITCHDPHTDASADERTYAAACLKCHAPASSAGTASLLHARVCPVNPADKCVGCHMPKRAEPLFPGQPRAVADHFIRVHLQPNRTAAGRASELTRPSTE